MAEQSKSNVIKRAEEKESDRQGARPGNVSFLEALTSAKEGRTVALIPVVAEGSGAAKKAAKKNQLDPSLLAEIPFVIKGKYWSEFNTFIGGRPKEQTVRDLVRNYSVNFVPVEGIPRDPMDPHYVKGGGKENICTVVHTTRLVAQAPDCYGVIVTGNTETDTVEEINWVRRLGSQVIHQVVTNGPMIDCIRRWVSAAGPVKVPGKYYIDPSTIEEVCKMLPWRPNYVRDMVGTMPDYKWLELNLKSSAGFPWDQPKKDPKVMLAAYQTACDILNGIRDGSIAKLLTEHPQWLLVKLMNKLDRYDMRELHEKKDTGTVRQYFVYGFHWVILFSALTQNVSQSMVGFWEDPRSFSAHGFSWQNGGPQRIVDWIRWAAKQAPGLYGIAYSDDQLWVVVCKDGTVYILVLDIKRMDLNLVANVGRLYVEYGKRVLVGKIDKTWEGALTLQGKLAFSCPVIVEHGLVFESKNHLHSGVPGTPEFDQVASAAAFKLMRERMGAPANLKEVKEGLEIGLDAWKSRLGLTVKPYEIFEAGKELLSADFERGSSYRTPWTFLGKHLEYAPQVRGWLPCSDPLRGLGAILAPKSRQEGFAGVRGQMQRVRQIVAAGLFCHPIIYRGANCWYQGIRKTGAKPADPFEPEDASLIDSAVDLELAMTFSDDEFPTWFEMANLYLPEGKKVDTRLADPTVAVTTEAKGTVTASRFVASLFEEDSEAPDSWADAAPDAPRVVEGDKGATNIQSLPTTSLEMTGRARPKTPEEKKAYEAARRERIQAKLANLSRATRQVFRGGSVSHRKGRLLLGEKAIALAKTFAEHAETAEDEGLTMEDSAAALKRYYEDLEAELAGYEDEAMEEEFYSELVHETGIHAKALYKKTLNE